MFELYYNLSANYCYEIHYNYVQMDRPHDALELISVVRVRAIPPKENKSMFHFEVHFTGSKRESPWTLRAHTQVYTIYHA